MSRETLTDLLDTLALLLVAAGVGALAYRWIGWACLIPAGLVVLAGSQVADRLGRPAVPSDGDL